MPLTVRVAGCGLYSSQRNMPHRMYNGSHYIVYDFLPRMRSFQFSAQVL
uniref:Uncharacterized protein n=1 Tax=Arundo donax TaxID=35708 RepID=A0A0A9BKV6_ARUDO